MNEQLNMELTKLISKAAIDGTLSENAVKQFTDVLKENKDLISDIEMQNKQLGEQQGENAKLRRELEAITKMHIGFSEREMALTDRERQHEVLEMSLKYEQKRVDDHKSMVGLIFRNAVMKKGVMTAIEGMPPGNGMCGTSGYANKDTVEEETI